MEESLYEIAGIINECFYYFDRFYYHTNKLYSIDTSLKDLPTNTNEDWRRETAIFINKCGLEKLKGKPFFTQLILDLNHIFQFSIFGDYQQDLIDGEFTRLEYGRNKIVKNLKEAIIFFRDAIVHPEHSAKTPSPRSLPTLPHINLNMYLWVIPNKNKTDFYIQIAAGKVWLKADILKCLNKLKEGCEMQDRENILKNFKWQKHNLPKI